MTISYEIAYSAIGEIEAAARTVVASLGIESAAREERDTFLDALICALIGQPNPMTEKPHSATSAEKAAKEADGYKERDKALRESEGARILAWAAYERAKLSAKLAVSAAGGAE